MKPHYVYDVNAPKKPVNLTANADLLRQAKSAGINLSRTFEEAVIVNLRASLEKEWLAENQEAIATYNDRVEKHGVFAAKRRRF